ncbi:T9SS type A sorting domain-containing protein [Saccharicrinis fermentans]|nr:T9SS type A sorting domain-containing protein [Saccharicrinis fermentans]
MDLSDVFYDEDEEDLQYKLAFSASYLDASISNNILSLTPLSNGLSTLEITALDARQASASTTFQVMIRNDSMPIDIYPNPVTDLINFRMGDEIDGNIEIEFYNDKAVMVNKLSIPISTFSPASSNISNMASGQYLLKIKYNNQEFERNIIKL